ncbi:MULTISPECIES: hypothetical protein [Enterococcus]|uniref:hypothetical protein n=1 Tax=Enterococcus TaxID=1350 RepID=UPI00065DE78B|nr:MULTISPECIES: hypothetical protein [Enterococcus]KAF1302315.1 hypothetical protein BAU16_07195 [Enterococcus sp. JM9B]
MKEIKSIYFIEETEKIEGSYIEVRKLFVAENQENAFNEYERLVQEKPEKSKGLILSEYLIKAESSLLQKLLRMWKQLPADFYRKINILNYSPIAEYCG